MKKFNSHILVIIFLVLVIFLCYSLPSEANKKQDLENHIKQLNTNISNKQYLYNIAERKYIMYTNNLRGLNAKLSTLQKKFNVNMLNLKTLSKEIDNLNKSIGSLNKQLQQEKQKSAKSLKAYYYFYNAEKYFPQSLYYEYMNKKIAHYLASRIKLYMEQEVLLNRQKRELVIKEANQKALVKKIDQQKLAIDQQKKNIAILAEQSSRLKQAYIRDIVSFQRQRQYLQAVLNRVIQEELAKQAELRRQRELERQRLLKQKQLEKLQKLKKEEQASQTHLSNLHVGLMPPVEGVIVDSFGVHTNPVFHVQTRNDGIDIKAANSSPVKAIAKGKVEYVGNLPGLGGVVIINNLNGYYSIYAHLNANVSKGQMVNEGQIIGHLSGDILHFELRKGSVPINPLLFINRRYLGG